VEGARCERGEKSVDDGDAAKPSGRGTQECIMGKGLHFELFSLEGWGVLAGNGGDETNVATLRL
jgi:hypothetical protein